MSPGAGLSDDLKITVDTTSDGTLNPTIYQPIR